MVEGTNIDHSAINVWEVCNTESWPSDYQSVWDFAIFNEVELTEDCDLVLNEYMLDQNPFTRRHLFRLIHFEDSMTYERAFADPAHDVQRIIQALSNPDCLLENISIADWTLKETCHADAFANYAAFYDACYRTHAGGSLTSALSEIPQHTSMPDDRMNTIWQRYLKQRWIERKCNEYGPESRLTIDRYPQQFELLRTIGIDEDPNRRFLENFPPKPPDPSDEWNALYRAFLSFAARLGDETVTFEFLPDQPLSLYFEQHQPWRKTYTNMLAAYSNGEKFKNAIVLITKLEEDDIKFDLNVLVEYVCADPTTKTRPKGSICRTLITSLHEHLAPTEETFLQALDRFKRVALELNLY